MLGTKGATGSHISLDLLKGIFAGPSLVTIVWQLCVRIHTLQENGDASTGPFKHNERGGTNYTIQRTTTKKLHYT
jgi:hypothetical protein